MNTSYLYLFLLQHEFRKLGTADAFRQRPSRDQPVLPLSSDRKHSARLNNYSNDIA